MARLADLENRIEAVAKLVEAYKPVAGIGISVDDVAGGAGRSISIFNNAPGSVNAAALGQLQIYKIDDTNIGITPGAYGPTVEDGTDTWTVSGDGQIWAQADVASDNTISNLVIFDNGSAAAPTPDTTHVYEVIGYYTTDGDGFLKTFPLVAGSQGIEICRSDPTTAIVVGHFTLV